MRKVVLTLLAVLVFSGCQSTRTFGQATSAVPAASSGGFVEWLYGLPGMVFGITATPASQPAAVSSSAFTASPVAATAADPKLFPSTADLAASIQAVNQTLIRADRRAGQARDMGWSLMAINGIMLVLMVLIILGVVRPFTPTTPAEKAILRKLASVRTRQTALAAAVSQLGDYVSQTRDGQDQMATLLAGVAAEMKKLDSTIVGLEQRDP